MSMRGGDLLSKKAQEDVTGLVKEIESKTSAEIVVVVRAISGRYLHADLVVGAIFALAWVCVFLFHPAPFDDDLVPAQMLAAFVLGMLLSVFFSPIRRLLTPTTWRNENVDRTAKAAFVENGVFRTSARTGLLVYVSVFERRVFLVGDVALESQELHETLSKTKSDLEASFEANDGLTAFVAALRELGTKLEKALPRRENDVNELEDRVAA